MTSLGRATPPSATVISERIPSTGETIGASPMKAIGLGFCSLSLRVVCALTGIFHRRTPSGSEAGTMMSLWYGLPVVLSREANQNGLAFRS
jgi:hypothetical protein